jgi:predicted nucleic-acid-binding Zn-ribbon protein
MNREPGATPMAASCPDCGKTNLFRTVAPISAGGGQAPNYLPGLGTLFFAAKFQLVVCQDCGLTRFYVAKEGLEKLPKSEKWKRM